MNLEQTTASITSNQSVIYTFIDATDGCFLVYVSYHDLSNMYYL